MWGGEPCLNCLHVLIYENNPIAPPLPYLSFCLCFPFPALLSIVVSHCAHLDGKHGNLFTTFLNQFSPIVGMKAVLRFLLTTFHFLNCVVVTSYDAPNSPLSSCLFVCLFVCLSVCLCFCFLTCVDPCSFSSLQLYFCWAVKLSCKAVSLYIFFVSASELFSGTVQRLYLHFSASPCFDIP